MNDKYLQNALYFSIKINHTSILILILILNQYKPKICLVTLKNRPKKNLYHLYISKFYALRKDSKRGFKTL